MNRFFLLNRDGGVGKLTGRGKTLTALLPTYLRGLPGRGSHVVTVNDYLAQRDADWMRPAYELGGLTVGCIQTPQSTDERRVQYARDVTYGTAKELGFDFLRDRLRIDDANSGRPGESPVQFFIGRQRHRVIYAEGPERLLGEWWINNTATPERRDYYRIEDEEGFRFWIFRDDFDRWFLHGHFA